MAKPKTYSQLDNDDDKGEREEISSPNGGMHPVEFEDVALANGGASAPKGGGGGGANQQTPGARWVRWAAEGRAKLESTIRSATGAGIAQRSQIDEVPEHWGLTQREMGRIERRWRLWSSAVRTVRPSADVDERALWDKLSIVSRVLASLQARQIFYGWVVMVVAAVAIILEAPVGDLAIAVAIRPMGKSIGCDEADVARALAIAHVFAGLIAPIVPFGLQWLGPGSSGALCAAVLATGMLVASGARTLSTLGFAFALAKVAGQGVLVPLVMGSLHGWWRTKRRVVDTIVAVVLSVVALGLAPAAVRFVAHGSAEGWRSSLVGGAGFALVVGVPMLLLLLPRPPNAYGQLPDGHAASSAFQGDEALEIADLPTGVWSFADAAVSFKFWLAQLALVTVRVHAGGLLFMHGVLVPPTLPRSELFAAVAVGGAVAAVGIGLSLDALRRKHTVLVVALIADTVALVLASHGPQAHGAAAMACVWGALSGGMVSVCVLTPGPLWCQLFGSVDAHRIELLSACTTLAASGIAIGVWAQWYDTFHSVSRALKLGACVAPVIALLVAVCLHEEVDGSVQSWQSLKAARDVPNPLRYGLSRLGRIFGRARGL